MATSMRASVLLTRACIFMHDTLLLDVGRAPGAFSQLQPSRGRRRTCRPATWHVPKKVSPNLYKKELTPENKTFLQDLHASEYEDRLSLSPLKEEPWRREDYTRRTVRTGLLAIKIGVQPQWTKDGKRFMTTLLQVVDNHAIRYVSPEEYATYESCTPSWRRRGFGMQVVGALSNDPFDYTKSYNNLFCEAGVPPKRKLTRFLITPDAAVQPGTPLLATHFRPGDYVDCQAKTIGHGFQGVVKRWKFKGGPKSHGPTKFQRRPGSIGGGGDKAAVWKGKKMPGHMGMDWRTLRGLKIWRINTEYNVLYVMGPCVPGPTHCYVRVFDSMLYHHRTSRVENPPHMPTWLPEDATEPLGEELFDEQIFRFSEPTINFDDVKGK